MTDELDWRLNAACTNTHPDLFFTPTTEHLAQTVCRGCPVAAECLTDALTVEGGLHAPSRFGVRGGLTPEQRANLARAQRRATRKDAS